MLEKIHLDQLVFGQSLKMWFVALGVAAGVFLMVRLMRFILVRWLTRSRKKDQKDLYIFFLACTRRINGFCILIVAGYLGLRTLDLPAGMETWSRGIIVIALIVQSALWVNEGITYWFGRYEKSPANGDPSRLTTLRATRVVLRLFLSVIAVLLALDNIPGVEITALVASLGIGGIAVALALQNVLGDLFASLSIVFDKPFFVGDFIIVDSYLGTVENIGLKTTRIRSLSGEQLIFSNNDLLKSRIRNYKRMSERRVVFSIGVTYETPADKLKKVPDMIRVIIDGIDKTRFDRAHFSAYGDFSLNFEIVYYVLDPDYNLYMDIQQEINLRIYRQFQEETIAFAYPTRTLYLNRVAEELYAENT